MQCKGCKTVSGRDGDRARNGRIEHGIKGPHFNLYKANQNPNNGQCFRQPVGAVSLTELPPGAMPIEPFAI